MAKKLTFEEVANRVNEFNPNYELITYINYKNIILKYLPTGEHFKCSLGHFLNGRAHDPSIVKEENLEKQNKTWFLKYMFNTTLESRL